MLRAVALAACLALAGPASAQMPPRFAGDPSVMPGRPDAGMRVQVNISWFVPNPADGDTEKAQERVRRDFYELAGRECDLLKATIASSCRLQTANIHLNAQAQRVPSQREGFTVNGSMIFVVAPK
jgi:hypothetical protein